MVQELNEIDDINEENSKIIEDSEIKASDLSQTLVTSKEWTVETVSSQINQNNIDLNPKFQRRNAWTDKKRSQLIESLIYGFPVPEIVLAESPSKRKHFIVIDGKQRLSAIAGFIDPEKFPFWDNAKLKDQTIKDKNGDTLNGLTFKELEENEKYADEYRQFMNASMRCTVIVTDFEKNDDILYHIFYRLNTSSVPLATQELRQVLHKGDFADYLVEVTTEQQPLQEVLGLKGPDKRLSDIEIILKFIAFSLFGKDKYKANLKKFLDESMKDINKEWKEKYHQEVDKIYSKLNIGISNLKIVFGEFDKIGRRYLKDKWTGRFNRNLFEAMVYYFQELDKNDLTQEKNEIFLENFKALFKNDKFLPTIESSTKRIESYNIRYTYIRDCINQSYKKEFSTIPVEIRND